MTAIAGASAGVRDMADGSLRITIEFEPKDAKAAFELFGSRGTPMAVAALKVGYAAAQEAEPPKAPRKDQRGPLCKEACDLCAMPAFREWIASGLVEPTEAAAKSLLCEMCSIESRKDLDSNPAAAQRFIERVRVPFMRHQRQRERAET